MKISPERREIDRYAADGRYKILPVSCEMLSDFTTPIEVVRILKNVSKHCFLLESAQASDTWGRYSFISYDPKLEITCRNGEFKARDIRIKTKNPAAYLRQIVKD